MSISMRRSILFAAVAMASFGIGFLSQSRSEPAPDRLDMNVRQDFFAGFAGNREAMARGMKSCEQILAVNPKNAEALVWHGTGLYYQAGVAFQSGDRENGMRLYTRSLDEMDTAVQYEPEMIAVRIPRGAALLAGTRMMTNQEAARPLIERAISDYEFAFSRQKDRLAQLGEHPRGELLFGLAEGWSRLGDQQKATAYFERILTDMEGTEYASRASIWMKNKSLPPDKTGCIGCHVK